MGPVKRRWIVPGALTLLGLGIRIWAVGHARFLGDESAFWQKGVEIATGETFPAYGASISGSAALTPGPQMFYFFAIPQLIGSSPWLVGIFCAIIGALLNLALFRLMETQVSRRAGLIALLLLTLNPWNVLYAERAWGGVMLMLLAMAAMLLAVRLKSGWAQGSLTFLCLIAPGINLQVPTLWAALIPLIAFGPKLRPRYGAIMLGAFLALATFGPAMYLELESDFSNTRAIFEHAANNTSRVDASDTPAKVAAYVVLFGSSECSFQLDEGFFGWNNFNEVELYLTEAGRNHLIERDGETLIGFNIFSACLALLGWLAAIGVLFVDIISALAAKERRLPSRSRMTVAVLLGAVLAATLMTVSQKAFFAHYLLMIIALVPWPIAVGLDALSRSVARLKKRALPALIYAACCVSALTMAFNTVTFYRDVDGRTGMHATVSMVGQVLDGPQPYSLRFTGIDATHVWTRVALTHYHRPLNLANARVAAIQYVVDNRESHWDEPDEEQPEDTTRHGAVLLRASGRR